MAQGHANAERGLIARGLMVGGFCPPHRGSDFAVRFAARSCDRLFLGLRRRAGDTIPMSIRHGWLKELYGGLANVEIIDPCTSQLPENLDAVFGSDEEDFALAVRLGVRAVPIDVARELVPVRSAQIRANPDAYWEDLLPCAKAHLARRVALFGSESTGKTILAQRLARYFRTPCVSEYVRGYADFQRGRLGLEDMAPVARGQIAQEEALARVANRVLICDTNLFSTITWSDWLYGDAPQWIREEAERRHYDLLLLTDIDVPWVEDPQRCLPTDDDRRRFHEKCRWQLESRGLPYVLVSGDWEQRFRIARQAVEELMARPR